MTEGNASVALFKCISRMEDEVLAASAAMVNAKVERMRASGAWLPVAKEHMAVWWRHAKSVVVGARRRVMTEVVGGVDSGGLARVAICFADIIVGDTPDDAIPFFEYERLKELQVEYRVAVAQVLREQARTRLEMTEEQLDRFCRLPTTTLSSNITTRLRAAIEVSLLLKTGGHGPGQELRFCTRSL